MKIVKAAIFLLVFSVCAFAQETVVQIEKELVAAAKDLQKYGSYGDGYDDEKLSAAQDAFQEKLLKYTKNASTLQHKFAALDEFVYIATSEDGRFRVYSWDMQDGGTMHNFANLYQYRGADGKVYSKMDELSEEDYGGFVTDIFTLDTKSGKVYIVCSTFIGSTKIRSQSADLYKIDGDRLESDVKLIKTSSGLTSTLNFGYDYFSVVDRRARPVVFISFDKKTKTLRIPVVVEDKEFPDGRVTNRSIKYRFDGTYFVKVS